MCAHCATEHLAPLCLRNTTIIIHQREQLIQFFLPKPAII